MQRPFDDNAANASPRSGSSKRSAPVVWGMIVLAIVALGLYVAFNGH